MEPNPATSLDPLILDLLEWCQSEPRRYSDVIEAWRTSCPRLTVWEDATDRGLIARQFGATGVQLVTVTPAGMKFLATSRHTATQKRAGEGALGR